MSDEIRDETIKNLRAYGHNLLANACHTYHKGVGALSAHDNEFVYVKKSPGRC